ncbi:DUF4145 domain-containing protein [Vibrio harveyi]|uniref:DUF4145 domain-containing protein n=1 Tax=Vibrio harveyi TaxID=669 RepID=UPI000681F183|nr:DUF4145 domain-containing protein [Vibrio harveyi]
MSSYPWTCPYCEKDTTITPSDYDVFTNDSHIKNAVCNTRVVNTVIVCPNPDCKQLSLITELQNAQTQFGEFLHKGASQVGKWQLKPSSSAKTFPSYIPEQILGDYTEACHIKDLSPKASATLSRRCIQGIIRDYWAVKPARLVDEINAIKDRVDPLVWDSIDTIRKIGNIGAHMEKDINKIIDVDPEEAELLIGLIEMLLREWYVLREERKARLQKIVAVGAEKQKEKQA